jgi:phage terminase large subunit-like protein
MTANRLAQIARSAKTLADRVDRQRSRYIKWLPSQHTFLHDPSKRKLLRCGNQWGGKTTAGLAEVNWRCTGKHPYLKTHTPPIEAWIVCASWSQSVSIQKKFWMLADKDELDPNTEFSPLKGFVGKNPAVLYRNGSIVRFKTTNQGGLNLAGSTIHVVHIDEPTEPRIYSELQKRVARTNGVIIITLTPINGPVDWLREMCENGQIVDHHYRLEPQNLIPVGCSQPLRLEDGTAMDAEWCEKIRAETMDAEEGVVVDGEWEIRVEGRIFTAFDKTKHVVTRPPRGKFKLCLGMDHGDGANFSEAAYLVAVDDLGATQKVHVLDEYVSEQSTTPDMDADGIVAMLARNGVVWEDLDMVYGDRSYGGRFRGLSKKSNSDLVRSIAKIVGVPYNKLRPFVNTVKRGEGHGRGSVDQGLRYLHHNMVRPGHFSVSPRCSRLIESLDKWDGRDDQWKHAIDALRYALDYYIFLRKRRPIAPAKFY